MGQVRCVNFFLEKLESGWLSTEETAGIGNVVFASERGCESEIMSISSASIYFEGDGESWIAKMSWFTLVKYE